MVPEELAPRPAWHSLRPVVMSRGGLVVAGTPLAAQAGARILRRGGTAMDAAIAAAAVQAVVMPHMNGPGGDMFLLHAGADGTVRALNASGPAPSGATPEAFRARGFSSVPSRGVEAVSVPGAVHGWFTALRECGRLTHSEVFEPAIEHAREGFPVHKNFIRYLESDTFQELQRRSPSIASAYFQDGMPPRLGQLLRQPELAGTLERIVQGGPDEFYRGQTAERIVETSSRLGGFLAREDLARYESRWTTPLSVDYRGLRVFQVPPNSQGVTMLQQLRALEPFDLVALGHNSSDYIRLHVEATRFAFADRDRCLADPDFSPVPVEHLISPKRAGSFMRLFSAGHPASGPAPRTMRNPRADTTCLVTIDGEGNAVSLIQSLFDDFGSGVFVEGAGFALQNRMCGFTLEPGHPNAVAPGKRPLHTLCCSLATQDARLRLAFANPGGHGQTQTLVQVLNNLLAFGMDVQEAVEAPRFIHSGRELLVESRIPEPVRSALGRSGYAVEAIPEWSSLVGGCAAIVIDPESGVRHGGGDPRRDSYAAVL